MWWSRTGMPQYARPAGPYPGNPRFCRGRVDHRRSRHAVAPRSCDQPDLAAAREPGRLSTWPDGKTITESNRLLGTCAKYPPLCAARWLTKVSPEESQIWELCVPVAGHQMPGRAGLGTLPARRLCLVDGLASGLGLKADWFAASRTRLDDRGTGEVSTWRRKTSGRW